MGPLDLIGKVSASASKQLQFERHVTKMLYTRLGYAKREVIEASKLERPLNEFYDAYTGATSEVFPFVVVPVVIASFNFLDIFTRPTRSIVVETYREVAAAEAQPGRPVAMLFQAYEIGVLVAVPYGTADVPALAIPPWCMIVHFDRWMNRVVGSPAQEG
jgi:hypothetical protein